jgi:hypothetical protein
VTPPNDQHELLQLLQKSYRSGGYSLRLFAYDDMAPTGRRPYSELFSNYTESTNVYSDKKIAVLSQHAPGTVDSSIYTVAYEDGEYWEVINRFYSIHLTFQTYIALLTTP